MSSFFKYLSSNKDISIFFTDSSANTSTLPPDISSIPNGSLIIENINSVPNLLIKRPLGIEPIESKWYESDSIYVDSSNAENGDGKFSNPFNNLNDCLAYLKTEGITGKIILIKRGVYNVNENLASGNILYGMEDGVEIHWTGSESIFDNTSLSASLSLLFLNNIKIVANINTDIIKYSYINNIPFFIKNVTLIQQGNGGLLKIEGNSSSISSSYIINSHFELNNNSAINLLLIDSDKLILNIKNTNIISKSIDSNSYLVKIEKIDTLDVENSRLISGDSINAGPGIVHSNIVNNAIRLFNIIYCCDGLLTISSSANDNVEYTINNANALIYNTNNNRILRLRKGALSSPVLIHFTNCTKVNDDDLTVSSPIPTTYYYKSTGDTPKKVGIPQKSLFDFQKNNDFMASMNIDASTIDVTSPNAGDLWNNNGRIKFRANATTTESLVYLSDLDNIAASDCLFVDKAAPIGGNGSILKPFKYLDDCLNYVKGNNIINRTIYIRGGSYTHTVNINTGNDIYCEPNAVITFNGIIDATTSNEYKAAYTSSLGKCNIFGYGTFIFSPTDPSNLGLGYFWINTDAHHPTIECFKIISNYVQRVITISKLNSSVFAPLCTFKNITGGIHKDIIVGNTAGNDLIVYEGGGSNAINFFNCVIGNLLGNGQGDRKIYVKSNGRLDYGQFINCYFTGNNSSHSQIFIEGASSYMVFSNIIYGSTFIKTNSTATTVIDEAILSNVITRYNNASDSKLLHLNKNSKIRIVNCSSYYDIDGENFLENYGESIIITSYMKTAYTDIKANTSYKSSLRIRQGVNDLAVPNIGDLWFKDRLKFHSNTNTTETLAFLSDFKGTNLESGSLYKRQTTFMNGLVGTIYTSNTFGGTISNATATDALGIVQLSTGNTATSDQGASIITYNNSLHAGMGTIIKRFRLRILDNFPNNTTSNGSIDFGFGDSNSSSDHNNFIGFRFLNSNNLEAVSIASSSVTYSIINSVTFTLGVWYLFKIIIDNTENQIEFYVNNMNSSAAIITTNIPNTDSQRFGEVFRVVRNTASTTEFKMQIDWDSIEIKPNSTFSFNDNL